MSILTSAYGERMLEMKRAIETSEKLKKGISECMKGHYEGSPMSEISKGGSRSVYRLGSIKSPAGEEYALVLKLYQKDYSESTKERIEGELATFEFFDSLGLPVPSFSLMVSAVGADRHGVITEDLMDGGKQDLVEYPELSNGMRDQPKNGDALKDKALLEWGNIFEENGFYNRPYTGLFVKIDKEGNGTLVFGDLDNLNGGYFSEPGKFGKIIRDFRESHKDGEYEIRID